MHMPSKPITTASSPPGCNIAMLRERRGWTQGQLAEAIDMDPAAISRIERNQGYTSHTLARIAAALGVSVPELFLPPELAVWATLSPAQRARLLDYLDLLTAAQQHQPPQQKPYLVHDRDNPPYR